MPSITVEDYVKNLFLLQQRSEDDDVRVPMGHLATAMSVVPGTATTMAKTLADAGLADYAPRAGVRLTDNGRALALHMLRRHRLVEQFLVETLGLDWSEVHDEAERLEHAISDRVLDRIDTLLGHPETDPHGAPIPTAKGGFTRASSQPLSSCKADAQVHIVRVPDEDPDFLNYLKLNGLLPGARLTITAHDPHAAAWTVSVADHVDLTLGTRAADRIQVAPRD